MPSVVPVDEVEVVMTGLSGRLPESSSIEEFAQQLLDNVDLVTADDRRWPLGLLDIPDRFGKLKDLTHFDATFFGISAKQVDQMDPQMRMLLELTHEAILDAGLNPAELRGTRTGVYIGVSTSESETKLSENLDNITGYATIGCGRCMFANRISYTFDLKGPSYAIDSACSSSTYALVHAFDAIKSGKCDAAVVAGSNICLMPNNAVNFHRIGMTSSDGRCAAFDASGKGYVRAEAAVVLLLQRREHARRVYATVRGACVNNDGYKINGITYPNGELQRLLAEETLQQAGLHPKDIAYVEAHGTGTPVGDPQEVNAIAELLCKDRTTPLLIGSVKSNMGHSESASGLCSIAKVLIAMERGVIPANLHFKTPNPQISALCEGRVKVVDRNTPWEGGLVAVNSFGFGGANAHIILESERGPVREVGSAGSAGTVPRLVVASGRTEAGVRRMLALAAAHPTRPELHALLDTVHAQNIVGHAHRGYTLLHHELDAPQEDVKELENAEPRPVWFVFTGMGAQWSGITPALMQLPVFAASVRRSAAALRPHNLDLLHLLLDAPQSAFGNIINSFVAITSVQIALCDLLREVGIRPDGIIGHSTGEVACAYADETLTAEQTILTAYWRGRSILEGKLPPGAMAAVGLSWEQCVARCPPGVMPACHNAADSVTISGPVQSIEEFITKLKSEGVFAKRLKVDYAFHSKYVEPGLPLLRHSLQQIIREPKPRSPRWISTSIPENCENPQLGKLSNAEYFVNNVVSPVRFVEALQLVPAQALVVELAPHALLQAVLKRALPGAAHVPLLRRDQSDQAAHLLAAIGKMYCAGAQPQVARLYPAVQFPVPRGTPGLASAVEWDHTTEWNVVHYDGPARSGENVIEYDLTRADDAFIAGHNIDGRVLFPATGYLALVWRTIAKQYNKKIEEMPIVFENVEFKQATIVSRDSSLQFVVNVLPGNGEFEVSEGGSVAVTGTVRLAGEPAAEHLELPACRPAHASCSDLKPLDTDDIYKELRLRGYYYTGVFRGICTSDAFGTEGTLKWEDNWISFMDTMLQFILIGVETRELYVPTGLSRAYINPSAHLATAAVDKADVPVRMFRCKDTIVAGGVEISGVKMKPILRRGNLQAPPKLEKYKFIPYENIAVPNEDTTWSKQDALTIAMQVILENVSSMHLKMSELSLERSPESLLTPHVLRVLDGEPFVRVEASLAARTNTAQYVTAMQELSVNLQQAVNKECHVVLCADVLSRHGAGVLTELCGALGPQGALLLEEPRGALGEPAARAMLQRAGLECVSRQVAASCEYLLLRRTASLPPATGAVVVEIPDDDSYAWLEPLRVALQRAETEPLRVYAVARSPTSGMLGLGTCLRAEPGGHALRVYFLPGERKKFAPDAPTFAAQVRKDLAVNVLCSGLWGSYRHLPIADTLQSQLQVEHAYVNTLVRGDLSSLRWIESNLRYAVEAPMRPSTELCHVYYAPLNFKDIMLATGRLPPESLSGDISDCLLGLEFSGKTWSGARVMGMVTTRGLATTVQADKGFLWEVPAAWSLEEAATVPVVYATAYYALVVRGRMTRGESVLVHAGSGGVGQAAIAIALHAGCTVYTTVGTADKRAFLLRRFPELIEDNIGNSRNTSFEQLVYERTNGRGVDLVLNSLAGDMLLASVRCLADNGRFLEIGKLDMSNNTELGMSMFLKNTTFHGVLLDHLFRANADTTDKAAVVRCVTEGIADGVVRPLPTTVFTDQQLEQAFRFMASGKHIGKVLIRVREEEVLDVAAPVTKLVSAIPRTYMHPGKSYVLVGGLGGFGLELGWWLVNRGARHLVLVGRSGVRSGYQAWCVRRWRTRGVAVRVLAADAAEAGGARAILAAANQLAPIGGVFNLAAVLRDAFFENQTPEHFRAVAAPKIRSTEALDAATREMAPNLDYFVVFSSMACGRGNPGQSNYGFSNATMERIVERRRADGLSGLAIQWGPIGDVGLMTAMVDDDMSTEVYGMLLQRISSCLEALGTLLALPHAITASMVLADKRRAQQQPQQGLLHAIANIFGFKDPSKVSQSATMADLGMDSLMGTEIKQTLERDYDLVLNVQEIRALTLQKLKKLSGAVTTDGNVAGKKGSLGASEDEKKPLLQVRLRQLMPKQAVVILPSAVAGEGTVFMVHPIEGVVDMLQTLAAGVRGRVFGLQCTREVPLDDMGSLARFYVQHVRAQQPRPPYTLLGYSFGAAIAFEMALQLQQVGCETRLVLVDGSPAYVAKHTNSGKNKRTVRSAATDEADALTFFAQQIIEIDVLKVGLELEQLDSWEARVACVAALVGAAPHEADALAAVASSFYRKLIMADSYRPATKLRAPVHLFTARESLVSLGEDYGLREVCTGALSITQLPADHRSIITGEPAATIAQCVSYLLSSA